MSKKSQAIVVYHSVDEIIVCHKDDEKDLLKDYFVAHQDDRSLDSYDRTEHTEPFYFQSRIHEM